MEIMTMGKVVVSARIENLQDTYEAEKGVLPAGDVRSVEVADAWWIPALRCCPFRGV